MTAFRGYLMHAALLFAAGPASASAVATPRHAEERSTRPAEAAQRRTVDTIEVVPLNTSTPVIVDLNDCLPIRVQPRSRLPRDGKCERPAKP